MRILVVEDDDVNADVARRILEKMGHHADLASNGSDAVDSFKTSVYDIVLMDSEMPVMNGYDATAHIRRLPGGQSVPIIGTSSSGDRLRCLMAGMNDIMPKPFERKKLALILAEWHAS